jgi:uncharacterized membrane protein YciS (DUF1049 family)
MVAMKAGDQTAASRVAVGDADSEAADELEPGALGGTMFGSVAVRERRSLWTILSILFFLGFVVSTVIVHSERNGAIDSVAKLAQDDAQLITAILTKEQLTTPVRGKSYDELGRKIGKTATRASVVGLTVWSSQGQILFSLNQSLVGTTPPDTQPLIVGIAQGSGGTRIVDNTVQTFLPVSKATDGPVAVVQLDQPFAVVEARIGGFWSLLRVVLALGLIASLLLLGLSLVSSRSLARAAEHDERPAAGDEGVDADDEGVDEEGADMEAEEQPVERLARELQTLHPALDVGIDQGTPLTVDEEDIEPAADQDTDVAVDQDADMATDQEKDLAAYFESQEAMRQRRDELKARAREAELRVKKLEAELHAAPSAPKSEQ